MMQTKQPSVPNQNKPENMEPILPWSVNLLGEVFPTTSAPNLLADQRVIMECPEEETWIPCDQTVHWGKRPYYIYPQLKIMKKEELPTVPRGSRLVAKLWYCDWSWDEIDKSSEERNSPRQGSWKAEPGSCSCFEDEKTMVPFERGVAVFRHLRINKEIKLKKTETFTITSLGVEIGYHNPYTKVPYRSLEIFLSRPTKIHFVAHKGSVKLMQKRGLLPAAVIPSSIELGNSNSKQIETSKVQKKIQESKEEGSESSNGLLALTSYATKFDSANLVIPSPSTNNTQNVIFPAPPSNKRPAPASNEVESLKKLKITQLHEVISEISVLQGHLDSLKSKIQDYMNSQPSRIVHKTVRVTCNPDQFRPILFIFYAFRTRNLELAVNLIKAFNFDINEKDPVTGYTVLHVAAKHAFTEGVQWCLQNGASVNAETSLKCTPLHLAYLRNNKKIRQLLKEVGKADKNAVNCYGLKPKDYHNNRKPLERPLPETTYSVEVVIAGFDKPFFLEVWFAARIGWLEVVRIYVEQLGCDVDVKNTNGQTPLMCATEHCHLDTVVYLLEMGADPNARDIHDSTPMHYAYMTYGVNEDVNASILKIIEILQRDGADPNLKNIWNRNPEWYKLKSIESSWKWSF